MIPPVKSIYSSSSFKWWVYVTVATGTAITVAEQTASSIVIPRISEEFGAVIIIVLMIIFLFFIYQVFKRLYFEKNNKVKLILVGSIAIILFQALIHIGVNIRLFPTTGMTLPFLSYGGSSILGTAILSGIILNLTKRRINQ